MSLFDTAKQLKVNDVILVRSKMKRGEEVFSCRVSYILEDVGLPTSIYPGIPIVRVGYVPCSRPDSRQCGFGSNSIPEDGAREWGWQTIEVVGSEGPRPTCALPSLYKNPGYDRVNM